MSSYEYDLFVIGAGSGGVRAARFAAGYGARVAIAEERDLGGTCVNVGCIPKKLFVYAAHYRDDFEDAAGFGWSVGERRFRWERLRENKDREIARLNGVYERLLRNAGVEIFAERAVIVDPHTVELAGGRRVHAEYILVATGSWPVVPEIPGREHAVTSNEMFHLDQLPHRAIIVGGGYIAVEFAAILHGLGVEVTQLYRGPHFLRGFDDDIRFFLAEEMRKAGISLMFNANVSRIERRHGVLLAELEDGRELEANLIMYATGRAPLTQGLGLEAVGVELDSRGAVVVDEHFRSSEPSIYAIGDVIDRVQLTPVALAEGMAVARTLFGGVPTTVDYDIVPTAVFSRPNLATVGLTEARARERFDEIDVYVSTFTPLKHTLTGRDEKSLMKLVVDRASDRVVGCHMVGPDAGEIMQGLAIALKCGATKAQFDATIGIHPTAAEEFVTMREPVPREP